ncbi:MAG: hypothetical protein LBR32_04880 [Propionibacteriaceae bacterium]|nr:hypothetical protein [Propionibacteriaceae bacterium]
MTVLMVVMAFIAAFQVLVPGARAADATVTFQRQPHGSSVYARGATLRLSAQAEASDGGTLAYQWKWSASADRGDPQPVAGLDGSDALPVLTATTPDAPGTYYYWVEASSGGQTAASQSAQVVVLDEIVSDTYTVGGHKADQSSYTSDDYDNYYLKNVKELGAKDGTTDVYHEWAGNQLYTSLRNGDFETRSAGGDTQSLRTEVSYWDSTRGIGTGSVHKYAKAIETQPASAYSLPGGSDVVANLSGALRNSIYQEVATVPGKVYDWSLKQAPHGDVLDIMAVVIGPADESDASDPKPWPYGVDGAAGTLDPVTGQAAAYTGASVGDPTLFERVVDALAAQLEVTDDSTLSSAGIVDDTTPDGMYDEFADWVNRYRGLANKAYTVTLDGKNYYVYLAEADADGGDAQWVAQSGTYPVPDGQGRTVFGLVNVYSSSTGGNLVNDVEFKSASAVGNPKDTVFTTDTDFKADTQDGYAYALAEVSGSVVLGYVGGAAFVSIDGEEQTEEINGDVGDHSSWYTPGEGTLKFEGLAVGKTYRLIGLPLAAISSDLGTNVGAADVTDEAFYFDTAIVAPPTVSWSVATAGEGVAAVVTAQEFAPDGTLVGTVAHHQTVAVGDTVRLTATTATAFDGWLEFRWNVGLPGAEDVVHRVAGALDAATADTFEFVANQSTQVSVRLASYERRELAYDANGGDGAPAPTANSLDDPDYQVVLAGGDGLSLDGYAFDGWSASEDGSGAFYQGGDAFTLTAPTQTLYAVWTTDRSGDTPTDSPTTPTDTPTDSATPGGGAADGTGGSGNATATPGGGSGTAQPSAAPTVSAKPTLPTPSKSANPGESSSASEAGQANGQPVADPSVGPAAGAAAGTPGETSAKEAGPAAVTPPAATASKVVAAQSKLYLVKGKSAKPAARAYLSGLKSSKAKLAWSSSKPKVVKVDPLTGKVKALRKGAAVITAAAPGPGGKTVKAKIKVTVVKRALAVKSVKAKLPKKLKKGKAVVVKAKWSPSAATGALPKFKSSNKLVAVIDSAGVLTAVKKGTVKITVKVAGKHKTYKLKVAK